MVYLRVLFTFFIACCRGVKYCDFYFAPIEEAKYFDDRVCVFVYLSDLYQIFLCMLPMSVAWFSSGCVAIRYVLPV